FFLISPRPPTSTLFPTRRSSDLSHQLIGVRGVAVFVGFARARLHPFAVDKVPENPWRYCRGHTSSWRFTRLPDFDPGRCGKAARDRKSTRLNSSHLGISYAVFCL